MSIVITLYLVIITQTYHVSTFPIMALEVNGQLPDNLFAKHIKRYKEFKDFHCKASTFCNGGGHVCAINSETNKKVKFDDMCLYHEKNCRGSTEYYLTIEPCKEEEPINNYITTKSRHEIVKEDPNNSHLPIQANRLPLPPELQYLINIQLPSYKKTVPTSLRAANREYNPYSNSASIQNEPLSNARPPEKTNRHYFAKYAISYTNPPFFIQPSYPTFITQSNPNLNIVPPQNIAKLKELSYKPQSFSEEYYQHPYNMAIRTKKNPTSSPPSCSPETQKTRSISGDDSNFASSIISQPQSVPVGFDMVYAPLVKSLSAKAPIDASPIIGETQGLPAEIPSQPSVLISQRQELPVEVPITALSLIPEAQAIPARAPIRGSSLLAKKQPPTGAGPIPVSHLISQAQALPGGAPSPNASLAPKQFISPRSQKYPEVISPPRVARQRGAGGLGTGAERSIWEIVRRFCELVPDIRVTYINDRSHIDRIGG